MFEIIIVIVMVISEMIIKVIEMIIKINSKFDKTQALQT